MVNQQEIEKSAKKIMDSFMKALKKVGKTKEDFVVKRDSNVRDKDKAETDPEFRDLMFKNAPKTKGDCIQAEKKKW